MTGPRLYWPGMVLPAMPAAGEISQPFIAREAVVPADVPRRADIRAVSRRLEAGQSRLSFGQKIIAAGNEVENAVIGDIHTQGRQPALVRRILLYRALRGRDHC